MALTINPAGSGSTVRWLASVGSFFLGVSLGGLASALLVMGLVGIAALFVPREIVATIAGLIGATLILRDFGVPIPVPYREGQVPETWRSQLPIEAASFAYGVGLGLGFATFFTSSAHGMMLLALPFVGSAWGFVSIVLVFSLGKSAVLWLARGSRSLQEVIDRVSHQELVERPRKLARRLASSGTTAVIAAAVLRMAWGA